MSRPPFKHDLERAKGLAILFRVDPGMERFMAKRGLLRGLGYYAGESGPDLLRAAMEESK